ncbi:rhamnose-binding lectin-like [Oculina patagonica]
MLRLLAFCLSAVLLCSTEGKKDVITVSEGEEMSLDCGTNFIHILSAAYGFPEKQCFAGRSVEVVMYECQGQHKCTLYAENTAFGDPCDGVTKNLAVDYSCVSTPPFQGFLVRACEDEVLDISCPTNINIISANYGRTTGEQVCNGDDVSNTNCGAAESIAIVRSACQGKQECSLKASNDVFGDPCDGITKYLEVRYECLE